MTEKEAREWQAAMRAKRRKRAELNQRLRDAAYEGDWDELDRIADEYLGGKSQGPIHNGTWEDPGVA